MICIILSRFIMNLRTIDLSTGQITTLGSGVLQDPRFSIARTNRSVIVGNLGAPLLVTGDDGPYSMGSTEQLDTISDDPLTTGIALEFFHDLSVDMEMLPMQ